MIGDYLGKFIFYDSSYEVHGRMWVAKVLVSLDTKLGFLEEMNLEMGGLVHIQCLDYEGIPFRCLHCHAMDHLVEQCPHRLRVKRPNQSSQKDFGSFN